MDPPRPRELEETAFKTLHTEDINAIITEHFARKGHWAVCELKASVIITVMMVYGSLLPEDEAS